MIFLFRLLPLFSAILFALSFWLQLQYPFQYPWIALLGVCGVLVSSYLLSRGRVKIFDLTEKMLPTLLFLLTLVFAILLSENVIERTIIIVIGTVAVYLSLELLFLLAFTPPRYPVHGLSRVNIAYVPFIIFYATATSVGLMTFIHTSYWIHIVLMTLLGLILFRTTGHPEATKEDNNRWMLIGMILGLHLGLIGAMLPISMYAQGAIAMLLFCGLLRLRRYLYHPLPSKKQAWLEGVVAAGVLISVVSTARWL